MTNNRLTPWEARQLIRGYKDGLQHVIGQIDHRASLEQIDTLAAEIADIARCMQEAIGRSDMPL